MNDVPWFILRDGTRAYVQPDIKICGRAKLESEATKHLVNCRANPYSLGDVIIVTDTDMVTVRTAEEFTRFVNDYYNKIRN